MVAFAFWDHEAKRLLLARDRIGKKPLVYARTARGLTFASDGRFGWLVVVSYARVGPLVMGRSAYSPNARSMLGGFSFGPKP